MLAPRSETLVVRVPRPVTSRSMLVLSVAVWVHTFPAGLSQVLPSAFRLRLTPPLEKTLPTPMLLTVTSQRVLVPVSESVLSRYAALMRKLTRASAWWNKVGTPL